MNDLKKHLQEVFDLLSNVPVSGQHVDTMYTVRLNLRKAYQLASLMEKEESQDE